MFHNSTDFSVRIVKSAGIFIDNRQVKKTQIRIFK